MNILVCIKQVPNTRHMTIDPDSHRLVRSGINSIMNPADRCALEMALRFRDAHGGKVTVVSMGTAHAEDVLKSAYLVGADRCILLTDAAFAGSDTYATSAVLAAAARYEMQRSGEPFHLIFCGRETIDGETGQVGPELAELLGCQHFTNIKSMYYTGSSCQIEYTLGDVFLQVDAQFPILVTHPLTDVCLRSSVHERLAESDSIKIPRLGYDDLAAWLNRSEIGLHGSATRVLRSYVPSAGRKAICIDQGTAAEKVRTLLAYLEKDGLLGGNTETTALYTDAVQTEDAQAGRICVFVEQDVSGKCREVSLELISPALQLKKQIGCKVCAILIGAKNAIAEQTVKCCGVDEIISCEAPVFGDMLLASYTETLLAMVRQYQPEGILFGATPLGKELASRLAGRCATGLTAECTGIGYDEESKSIIWSRPAYGGKLMADIICPVKRPQMGTIRQGVFVKPIKAAGNTSVIRFPAPEAAQCESVRLLKKLPSPTAKQGSDSTQIIVGMGRGVRDMDGFDMICDFADTIGAGLGASRGAVEMRFISQQYLIGSNGQTVRPKIYFACGISGSMQHLTGVMDARCIVAINKDPNAEIFRYADYGIVGDLFQIIPELEKQMDKS